MADNYLEKRMEDLRAGRIDAETRRLIKRNHAKIAARKAAEAKERNAQPDESASPTTRLAAVPLL